MQSKMYYQKKYDHYWIQSCEHEDLPHVRDFLNTYWQKGHILFIDREYLEWQYYNTDRGNYNFLIARDNDSREMLGMIGFIPTRRYDPNITFQNQFIWLTCWMIKPDIQDGGLGIKLLLSVFSCEGTNNIGTVGNYESVVPLYSMLRFDTGILDHFYIINRTKKDFVILTGLTGNTSLAERITQKRNAVEIGVIDAKAFSEIFQSMVHSSTLPYKTENYFVHRYLHHPKYDYELLAIKCNGKYETIFVIRTVFYGGSCAIRVVDGCGGFYAKRDIYDSIQLILQQRNAEYIDIFCKGIDRSVLNEMGFFEHHPKEQLIFPNLFEPFLCENKEIRFAYYHGAQKPYIIFKGDGDQDRPNQLFIPRYKI